jgi:Tfp pilus assembly protein PilN
MDARKKLQSAFGDDSFLDVIAPASTAVKCEINLMPEEMILKKTVDRQSKEASKSGVAAVIIMLLIGAMIMSNIYFKDTFLNKNLREQFASQKKQVKKLEEQMNKAKLVRGYIQGRMVSLDIIHELYTITPHSIYLSNISVDENGTVIIDGISESMSQVFSYVKSLNDSALFKEAKTKSTSTKKDNGKDVAAFEIEFKLHDSKEPAA